MQPTPPSGSLLLYYARVNPTGTKFTRPISTVLKRKPLPCNRQARVKGRSRVLFIIYYSRVYLREAKAKGRKRRIDSSVQGPGYSYRCLVPSVAVSSTVTTVIAASGVEMPNRRLHDMPL